MAVPHVVVIGVFVVAIGIALAIIGYMAWRGSKTNPFFLEAVPSLYPLTLPDADIDFYEDLKERLQKSYAPEALGYVNGTPNGSAEAQPFTPSWAQKVPPEELMGLKHALMKRLVACIDPLDQVQRDKPGNWKLWRGKLVSERYWNSLVDGEKIVSEEIDACIAEANELEPGWRDHVFQQAVQIWRRQKQELVEKKEKIKEKVKEKKSVIQEVKRVETDKKKEEEDKKKQERLAEKAMEQLLREEEKASAAKNKAQSAKSTAKAKGAKKK